MIPTTRPNVRFIEHTQDDTLYRVEEQIFSRTWRVTGYTRVPTHEKPMAISRQIRDEEVEDEMHEMGLDVKDWQTRTHTALRLGMLALRPQIAYRKAQLLGEEYEPAEFGEKFEMDPVLVEALKQAERDRKDREEKQRLAQERRERERAEMESAELWGAF